MSTTSHTLVGLAALVIGFAAGKSCDISVKVREDYKPELHATPHDEPSAEDYGGCTKYGIQGCCLGNRYFLTFPRLLGPNGRPSGQPLLYDLENTQHKERLKNHDLRSALDAYKASPKTDLDRAEEKLRERSKAWE